jgi:hypothetical protein
MTRQGYGILKYRYKPEPRALVSRTGGIGIIQYITDVCFQFGKGSISHAELQDACRNVWRSPRGPKSHEMPLRHPTRFNVASSFQRSLNNNDAGLGLTYQAWAIVDGGPLQASRHYPRTHLKPSAPFSCCCQTLPSSPSPLYALKHWPFPNFTSVWSIKL